MAKKDLKQEDRSKEEKTTDKSWEFPFYNKKGYLNKPKVGLVIGGIVATSFVASNVLLAEPLFYMNQTTNLEEMVDANFQFEFITNYFNWSYKAIMSNSNGYNPDSLNALAITGASLTLSSLLGVRAFKNIRKKAFIQESLSSMHLSQYYLKKINLKTNTYTFKLLKGEQMDYDGFINHQEDIAQLFGMGKMKTGRTNKNEVVLQFFSPTPELQFYYKGKQYSMQEKTEMIADGVEVNKFVTKSTCKRTDFEEFLGEGKSIIGVMDLDGKPIYATFASTVGVIQGHTLIAGGTGSGKSYLTTNFVKTFFIPENYKNLNNLYCINLKKGSIDWKFLEGIDKVTNADIINGWDEVLNTLKKAQLEMIANSRDNTLQGIENTKFGQSILIVDEIHMLKQTAEDRTAPKVVREKAEKCLWILDQIATQARSSNMFIIAILQKATLDNISGNLRSQIDMGNGILLKADDVTSQIIIDEETQKANQINPKTLSAGKFIYCDNANGLMREGFAIETVKKFDAKAVNKYSETKELIDGRERTEELKELAKIVATLEYEKAIADEEDKDRLQKMNSYDELDAEIENYWEQAEEILAKRKSGEVSVITENDKKDTQEFLNMLNTDAVDGEDEESDDVTLNGNVNIKSNDDDVKIENKEELNEKAFIDKKEFEEKLAKSMNAEEDDLEEEIDEAKMEKKLEDDEKEDAEFEKFDALIQEQLKSVDETTESIVISEDVSNKCDEATKTFLDSL